jgi:hypothetical protein
MEKAVALAAKTPGAEDLVANQESFGVGYSGHLQQARGGQVLRCNWRNKPDSGSGLLYSKVEQPCVKDFLETRPQAERDGSAGALQGQRGGVWRCLR